jgi:mono/diheme cytochrome c family protein
MSRDARTPPSAAAGAAAAEAGVLVAGLLWVAGLCWTGATAAAQARSAAAPAGVANPQRAWQNWTLNCQGCHRQDGTGSEGTAPSLAGTVAKFLTVPGGREYLGRVPGVATSALPSAELAEVMNWMFWRFDREHLPADFLPFSAEEIGRLRTQPLRLEASEMRSTLLKQAGESASP